MAASKPLTFHSRNEIIEFHVVGTYIVPPLLLNPFPLLSIAPRLIIVPCLKISKFLYPQPAGIDKKLPVGAQ